MNREMRNAVPISAQQPGFFSRLRQQRLLYLMLLPTLIAVAIFSYKPLMYWIVAFKDYRPGQNMFACDWVGLKYFKEFFQNGQDAVYVIRNTLVINLSSLVINLFSAMVFSIVLNEIRMKKLRKVVQTVSIFPFFEFAAAADGRYRQGVEHPRLAQIRLAIDYRLQSVEVAGLQFGHLPVHDSGH